MVPSGISSRAERFLVILFAGLSFYSHLYGIEVDSVTAKTVAKNFYLIQMAQSSTVTKKGISQDISLDLVHKEYSDLRNSGINQKKGAFTLPLYYVFNVTNQKGFVIVSGDDRVPAILGYAFEGAYLKNDQPPAFQAWMLNYKNQIIYAIENDLKGDLEDIKDWDIYRGIVQTKGIKQIEEVSPLISTAWHQNCYYNYYCPYDTDGDCNRAYAGCVAVAMAQIMKYWEHPYSCNNIPGYDDDINLDPDDNEIPGSDYGWISGISSTAYNWSAMTNTLSSSSSQETMEALCGLLYHCGVSVEMNYGPESSAAFSHKASQAFQSIFKYAQSTNLLNKDDFSDSEWDLILKNELDNYRPVYYDGCIEDGGCHAFICDGYQGSSHFHFEWGWGGSTLNGYYYLDDLVDGSILFPIWQSAIIGIQPDYAVPDPCYNGIEIEHCDWTYAFVGGSSDAAWNTGMCGIFAPGREQIYGFIAPQTGNYSIEVRNASGPVAYGWQEADCSVEGWNCIGVFDTPGVYGTMSWTAGSIYYILLDDTDNLSGNTSFAITCVSAEAPDLDYYSHEIDDDNSTSSGDNDGLVEPGETIEMPVTLLNSGAGDAHNVSAHLSTTDPYINITDGDQSWGTITAGATDTSVDYDFSVSASCPERDVTFILDISSDENTWTDQFTVHVYAPQINPCDNIISIGGCGSGNSQTYSGGGSGSWNNSMCNFSTPGTEQIYSFVAPQTGTYSIEVLSANGYVDYGWSTSCGESGWTCIDDIASMGAYGTMSWTAGTTYYLLLDNEDATTGTHEFFINCPIDPPYLEYHSHVIDDDNSTSSGDNDGLVEPGETIEMPVTLLNSGAGDAHNVSAHLSTTDPYINITDGDQSWGTITAGATDTSVDYDFSVSASCPERDVTFILDISSDENTWTDQFTVHVYAPQINPCDNIISIGGCGSGNSQTYSGGGSGSWNNSMCNFSTPGTEQIYSFVAPQTGTYSIEVLSANGYVDYGWSTSCGESGWTCIDDIASMGAYGTMSWTAGTTYYLLLDNEDATTGTHEFFINCPIDPPYLEYHSHVIDDDNSTSSGDNDGLVEPGETIEMPVTLLNSGAGDANNVSAHLSTTDPYITITDADENYGDISAGWTAESSADYDFSVSPSCPEGDVTFTLGITSDEDSWTNQFTITISVQPSTYLEVSPNSRTVAATAGTTSFSVSTNVEWSVTDDASWLTATKTDGTTISVSYSSNTSTSSRTANITVTGTDGISETLTITQSFVSNYINLTPYLPSGWEDKIVVSSERGTFLNGDVTEGQASYIDFAWINDGNVDAGNHKCRLYFDEQEILWAEVPNLTSGYYQNGVDGKYFFIETGWHMLKLIVDADNSVNELNEFDNVYEKQIYIHSITSYRNNLSLSERVLVFPNPTSGMFQLEIQYAISDSYIIKIADPTGKIIMNRKIENQGFVISESVDISWNPSGIYFLQISDNTASVVRKIVIAK